MPIPEDLISAELEETWRLLSRGRFERARAACSQVLAGHPSEPRVRAQMARLEALTGRIAFSEAEARVRDLIRDNPSDPRLVVLACELANRQGDSERALAGMTELAVEYPADPNVHEFLAELLRVRRRDFDSAWDHFNVVLQSRPLASACLRQAAYSVGRISDPMNARLALAGTTAVERAVILSRVRGAGLMFLVLDAVTIPAIALRAIGHSGWSLLLMGLATAWAAWAIYGNDLVCCKKCRNAWVLQLAAAWILFGLTPHNLHGAYLAAVLSGGAIGSFIMFWRDRNQLRKLAARSS